MLPALIWKLLEWIWYSFISKTPKPDNTVVDAAKCPISGAVETEATKCPGSALKDKASTSELVESDEIKTEATETPMETRTQNMPEAIVAPEGAAECTTGD